MYIYIYIYIIIGQSEPNLITTEVPGTQTDTTLRGLRPRSLYKVHVVAENAVGRSPPSKVLTITTDDEGYFYMIFS